MSKLRADGPWTINPLAATYRCVGTADHNTERMAMLTAIGGIQFSALSVGSKHGQVAIIPLDESNMANAKLISAAPDLLEFVQAIAASTIPEFVDYQQTARDLLAKVQS